MDPVAMSLLILIIGAFFGLLVCLITFITKISNYLRLIFSQVRNQLRSTRIHGLSNYTNLLLAI